MEKVDKSKKDKQGTAARTDLPNAYELFLTTIIPNEDFEMTLRILQGYCAISPSQILTRKLTWEGPRTRTPAGIDAKFIKNQPALKVPQWSGLSVQLSRQSYIIHILYEVDRQSFGKTESGHVSALQTLQNPSSLDQRLGVLRWNDLPDPTETPKLPGGKFLDPNAVKLVNTRLMFSIENQGLCTFMKMINHRFVREVIQESYRFVHGDIIFELTRYLQFPMGEDDNPSIIRTELPDFDALTPFDSENKWILTASTIVARGDNPQQMKKGTDQLVAVKDDFEGCFDFRVLDRHIFDTRVKF